VVGHRLGEQVDHQGGNPEEGKQANQAPAAGEALAALAEITQVFTRTDGLDAGQQRNQTGEDGQNGCDEDPGLDVEVHQPGL